MRRLLALFIVATSVHLYWIDGDGDKSKTVLVMEYSDGTVDKIVVNKKDLATDRSKIVNKAYELLEKKGVTSGD